MHILLVKMSSMGDVLHTLPALSDAKNAIPDLQVDWIVEPAFADIPAWHQSVVNVITLPLRQWRKHPIQTICSGAFRRFKQQVQAKKYDLILDAQGLLKSTWITKLIHAESHGFDKHSAREPLSSYFYRHKHCVAKNQHAIQRVRALFSNALQYQLSETQPDFQIDAHRLPPLSFARLDTYFVFLHATTWATKHYPDEHWRELLKKAADINVTVYLPWGNEREKIRAEAIAQGYPHAIVPPPLSLAEMAALLHKASAVIAVDTGLGHLSAALNVPTISLYGPTNPAHVGAKGLKAINLAANFPCAPCVQKNCAYAKQHKTSIEPACYTTINPDMVLKHIEAQ